MVANEYHIKPIHFIDSESEEKYTRNPLTEKVKKSDAKKEKKTKTNTREGKT